MIQSMQILKQLHGGLAQSPSKSYNGARSSESAQSPQSVRDRQGREQNRQPDSEMYSFDHARDRSRISDDRSHRPEFYQEQDQSPSQFASMEPFSQQESGNNVDVDLRYGSDYDHPDYASPPKPPLPHQGYGGAPNVPPRGSAYQGSAVPCVDQPGYEDPPAYPQMPNHPQPQALYQSEANPPANNPDYREAPRHSAYQQMPISPARDPYFQRAQNPPVRNTDFQGGPGAPIQDPDYVGTFRPPGALGPPGTQSAYQEPRGSPLSQIAFRRVPPIPSTESPYQHVIRPPISHQHHEDEILTCPSDDCIYMTMKKADMDRHQAKCEFALKSKCALCGIFLANKETLWKHQATTHGDTFVNYECIGDCGFSTVEKSHRNQHQSICVKAREMLKKQMSDGEDPGWSSVSPQEQLETKKPDTASDNESPASLRPSPKDETSFGPPSLSRISPAPKAESSSGPSCLPETMCRTCKFVFPSKEDLWCHAAREHPHKHHVLPCNFQCGFKTVDRSHLVSHMASCRTPISSVCNVCNTEHGAPEDLWMHKARSHPDMCDVLSCGSCPFVTVTDTHLQQHRKQCTGASDRFSCRVCTKKFSSDIGLKSHSCQSKKTYDMYNCRLGCGFTAKSMKELHEHEKQCSSAA